MLEIFLSAGEGEPYIIVPEQFKLPFFEWLKEKIPCTFPRSSGFVDKNRQTNAVMELVDTSVKEAEKPIDEWFHVLSVPSEKGSSGNKDNPTSVTWHFDSKVYQQAQAEWLEVYRNGPSQEQNTLRSA